MRSAVCLSLALALLAALAPDAVAQNPKISELKPSSAPAGSGTKIMGSGFKPSKLPSGSKLEVAVNFDDEAVNVSNAGDKSISVRIPSHLKPGSYKVQVLLNLKKDGDVRAWKRSRTETFIVEPRVTKVDPAKLYDGAVVTIHGGPFEPKRGSAKPQVFIDGDAVRGIQLSDDKKRITFTARKLKPGDYEIEVRFGRGKSASASKPRKIKVIEAPKQGDKPVVRKIGGEDKPGGEIEVIGKNFTKNCQVFVDGQGVRTKFVDDNTLSAKLDVKIEPGKHDLQVIISKPFEIKSNTTSFTVRSFEPQIDSVQPESTVAGGPVKLIGKEIGPGCEVVFNDVVVKTGVRPTTEATFNVPIDTPPGNYQVYIRFGNKKSRAKRVKIGELNPKLTKLSPEKQEPGGFVSLRGEEFGFDAKSGATVYLNGQPAATDWYGNKSLRFMITPGLVPGKYKVEVRVGKKKSNALEVEVLLLPPKIRSATKEAHAGETIEIAGKGFLAGTRAILGGRQCEVTEMTFDRIVATVPRNLPPGEYEVSVDVPQAGVAKGPRKVKVLKPLDEEEEE